MCQALLLWCSGRIREWFFIADGMLIVASPVCCCTLWWFCSSVSTNSNPTSTFPRYQRNWTWTSRYELTLSTLDIRSLPDSAKGGVSLSSPDTVVAKGEALSGTISQTSGLGIPGANFRGGSLEGEDGSVKGGKDSIVLTRFE